MSYLLVVHTKDGRSLRGEYEYLEAHARLEWARSQSDYLTGWVVPKIEEPEQYDIDRDDANTETDDA